VLGRGALWEARAAALKGGVMLAFGLGVAAEAVAKAFRDVVPRAEAMGVVGVIALVANAACLLLLLRHRTDGINMRSTWLCSRNDVVANVGVLLAAAGVAVLDSRWPDLLVGATIAALFLGSAFGVLRDSVRAFGKVRGA
jgi:Co/Zn/Cd efflux system component